MLQMCLLHVSIPIQVPLLLELKLTVMEALGSIPAVDPTQMNQLQKEFVAYQLLDQPNIPDTV